MAGRRFTGARLKTARLAASLSQRELAAHAGMSHGTVARLERDEGQAPRLGTIRALATALAIEPEALLGWEGPAAGAPVDVAVVVTIPAPAAAMGAPFSTGTASSPEALCERVRELHVVSASLRRRSSDLQHRLEVLLDRSAVLREQRGAFGR